MYEALATSVCGLRYNGKLSTIDSDDFMRHFHWSEMAYDKNVGAELARCSVYLLYWYKSTDLLYKSTNTDAAVHDKNVGAELVRCSVYLRY